MPSKSNTNRGQDVVFLTNTASDSRATKSSIFSMIFGKNERSCTLPYYKRVFAKRRGNCGDLARLVLLLLGMIQNTIFRSKF